MTDRYCQHCGAPMRWNGEWYVWKCTAGCSNGDSTASLRSSAPGAVNKPLPSVTICEWLGVRERGGRCPHHGGDNCLAVYVRADQ